jgi:hypothetical protein
LTVTGVASQNYVQGMVWADFNNDGNVDFGEKGIAGIVITLTASTGQVLQTTTDANGLYTCRVAPGMYTIAEGAEPAGYVQGKDTPGIITDQSGNPILTASAATTSPRLFSSVQIGLNQNAINFNFGELPAPGSAIAKSQSAGIGFWQNKNGQALISKFTNVGNWLAATLPNTFGINAGANNLTGQTAQQVIQLYQQDFALHDKLDAQFMATALNVFATDASLGGSAASAYGFSINQYGLGDATLNVGSDGAAFGVANNTTLTVMQILQDADKKTVNGVLYGGTQTLRQMATDLFGAINSMGGI